MDYRALIVQHWTPEYSAIAILLGCGLVMVAAYISACKVQKSEPDSEPPRVAAPAMVGLMYAKLVRAYQDGNEIMKARQEKRLKASGWPVPKDFTQAENYLARYEIGRLYRE